ncbi:MAG: hypothetical protein R2828_19320 [Saprospiraceae bacterium]
MEKLKELVNLINKGKLQPIEIIGNPSERNTKLIQFFDGLQDGTIRSDEEAFKLLYGGDPKNKNAYYKLKHTLRERLYNTLYFIDVKKGKYGNYKTAKLSLQKVISTYNLLFQNGGSKNALDLATNGLKTAENFELMEEAFYFSIKLRGLGTIHQTNRKKMQYYHKRSLKYMELLKAESLAEGFVFDLISLTANQTAKEEVHCLADQYLKKLTPFEPAEPTLNLIYYKSSLQLFKYMGEHDYISAADVCQHTLKKLQHYRFLHAEAVLAISTQYAICCAKLKRYEAGSQALLFCLDFLEKGSFNAFKIQELHLNLALHTGHYQEAFDIVKILSIHKKFKTHFLSSQKIWGTYLAWLHYLSKRGLIALKKEERIGPPSFQLQAYLNKTPVFSEEERGIHVPMLIGQIVLLYALGRQATLLSKKLKAISKYGGDPVTDPLNARSHAFIKMLLEIHQGGLRRQDLEARTGPFLETLRQTPTDLADQNIDLEILPLETVWEFLLAVLNTKMV